MSLHSVRIPPDSTGKRLKQVGALELDYQNGTVDIVPGDTISGATSGFSGVVERVSGTTISGEVYIVLDRDSVAAATSGENLMVGGSKVAEADGVGTPYYLQKTAIAGGNNTENEAFVNEEGSLQVGFSGGSAGFQMGRQMVTSLTTVLNHPFAADLDDRHFVTVTSGLATMSVTHDAERNSALMSIGTTTDSKIAFVQNMHNKPPGGAAFGMEVSISSGDSGKAGVIRRVGMFSSDSGLFFEMNGTDIYVVTRSNATGSIVDTKVLQEDWNGDNLSGDGGQDNLSRHSLDPTKVTSMFLEYNEIRMARFGFFIGGERVVAHTVYGENFDRPMITDTSLPIHFEIENTSATASTSEMHIFDTGVYVAQEAYDFEAVSDLRSFDFSALGGTVVASGVETFLFAGRAKKYIGSERNHTITLITDTYTYVDGNGPVAFTLYKNPTLSGALWAIDPASDGGIEIDVHTSSFSGGIKRSAGILQPGMVNHNDLNDLFNYKREYLSAGPGNTDSDIYVATARTLRPTDSVTLYSTVNWIEVK